MRRRWQRHGNAVILVCAAVVLLALSGTVICASVEEEPQPLDVLPSPLLEHIRANRPVAPDTERLEERFLELLYPYVSEAEGDAWQRVLTEGQRSSIALEDAVEDLDVLFEILRHAYAGYALFGGELAFEEARANLEAALSEMRAPILASRFARLIADHLDFVQDGHFYVGPVSPLRASTYMASTAYEVRPREEGLVLYESADGGDRIGLLVAVNGEAPAAYLKPSLDAAGAFVYRLGVYGERRPAQLDVLARDEEDEVNLEIRLSPVRRGIQARSGRIYHLHEHLGIPVATCRGLMADGPRDRDLLDAFVRDAGSLGAESCLILDLRDNHGGVVGTGYAWLRGFVHDYWVDGASSRGALLEDLEGQLVEAMPLSRTSLELLRAELERLGRSRSAIERYSRHLASLEAPEAPGWAFFSTYRPLGRMVNDTVLVVLVDGHTYSAAEWFVDVLRHMENVIVIGHPTAGVLTTGSTRGIVLPHSGLSVLVPTAIHLGPNLEVREGRGIEPDLWVEPSEALEVAARFLRHYFGCEE